MKDFQVPTGSLPLNRRRFGRLALGGSAALALAACGGGGGGDDSNGHVDLYEIYDKVVEGMSREDVADLIGELPNNRRTNDYQVWRYGNQILEIVTFAPEFWLVSQVSVDEIGGPRPYLSKGFDR